MGRMQRSSQLVGQSYRVLMQDTELMLLPLMSGIVMAVVVAIAAFGVGLEGLDTRAVTPAVYVPLFLLYVVLYATGIFFQCAVIAGATERLRGGNPTLGSALGAASLGIASFAAWMTLVAVTGLLAWTVGTPAVVFFVPCAILLLIFFSALQGVYVASLYRYAADGVAPDGFDRHLLAEAFVEKGRR